MKIQLKLYSFILIFFICTLFSQPRILILHSYHISNWTTQLQRGIDDGLKTDPSIDLFIEYMDTQKSTSNAYYDLLFKIYQFKYSSVKFDLILTTDNNALDFALTYRDSLFKDCPLVFCGVNDFDTSILINHTNITGVTEKAGFDKTIAIALKARPACDTIFIINDKSEIALINKQEFFDALKAMNVSLPVVSFENDSFGEMTQRVKTIRNKDIIVLITFWKDINGAIITNKNITSLLNQSNAPVFGRSEWMIDKGMTGGWCVSAYSQGYEASQIASHILNGESADRIPVMKESPGKYIFNYAELKQNRIPLDLIPKESIVVNKPNLLSISPYLLLMFLLIVLLLIACIVLLTIFIRMRKKGIQSLTESEEKYRQLIEGTDLLVTKLTANGTISFVNQKSERFIGLSPSECIGKQLTDFIHSDDRAATSEKLRERITKKQSCSFENRVIHSSGNKIYHFLWTVTAINDAAGNCIGMNSIGRDISSYKEIQNQLQHASKMKAIGTLAGGIAHDFNNLLAGILGYTEVALLETPDTNSTRPQLLEIKKISMRARELIRHILTFSRQTPFDPYPVRINEIVEEVIPLLRATIPSTIEFKTSIDYCGNVLADQSRIHQILINLCTNSYHAMEDKGGILSIDLHKTSLSKDNALDIPEGDYILLSIADTGTGIPHELQAHIFDPFFTTKKVNKGTGLGLSVVHGIVTELNSFIRFTSETGKGSTFNIYFPPSAESVPKPPETVHDIAALSSGSESIIIVDDEEIIAGSLNAILKKHGYHTNVFTSSKLAYEMISNKKVNGDLLITDLTMPEMSGIDLINGLARTVPELPVILCTGYNDQVTEDAMRQKTVEAYLSKPFDMKHLLKIIRATLDKKQSVASADRNN